MNITISSLKMTRIFRASLLCCFFMLCALFNVQTFAQELKTDDDVPTLDICGDAQVFTVRIGKGAVECPNGVFTFAFPNGMEYVAGSAEVGNVAATITNLTAKGGTITLRIPAGLPNDDIKITFKGKATCDALAVPQNERFVTYLLSGCGSPKPGTSNNIGLRYAKLNVTVPVLTETLIGKEVERVITVKNSGNAPITGIRVPATYSASVERVGATLTNGWTHDVSTNTYSYNGKIAPGSSVSFKETVKLKDCGVGTVNYSANYGCNTICVLGSSEVDAINTLAIDRTKRPNLTITASKVEVICLDNSYQHTYIIKNTGNAIASDVIVDLLAGGNSTNISDVRSNYPNVIIAGNKVTMLSILPNETFEITFNQKYPITNKGADCAKFSSSQAIDKTSYNLFYTHKESCEGGVFPKYVVNDKETKAAYSYNFSGQNIGEVDAIEGTPYEADFRIDDWLFPAEGIGADAFFNLNIEMSASLSAGFDKSQIKLFNGTDYLIAGTDFIVLPNGPTSYTLQIKKGTKSWPAGSAPLNFGGGSWRLQFPMNLTCPQVGEPWYKISGELNKGSNCTETIKFKCQTVSLFGHCGNGACTDGGVLKGEAKLKRLSLGYLDINNDALPDNPNLGLLPTDDLSKIQTRSFVAGDTLLISQLGTIIGNGWTEGGGFTVESPKGITNELIPNSGSIIITRGLVSYTIPNLLITKQGTNIFELALPKSTDAVWPSGITSFEDGDKIVVSIKIKPTTLKGDVELKIFPTALWLNKGGNKFSCGRDYKATGYYGSTTLGVSVDNDNFKIPGCSTGESGAGLKIDYAIAGRHSRNALFINEFRQLATPRTVTFTVPSSVLMTGYVVELTNNKPGDALKHVQQLTNAVSGTTYEVKLADALLSMKAGTVNKFLDEGFVVTVRPIITAKCDAPLKVSIDASLVMDGTFQYLNTAYINETIVTKQVLNFNTDSDKLNANAQAPKVVTYSAKVKWVVEINNSSTFREFGNVWLGKKDGDANIVKVQRITSLTDHTPIGAEAVLDGDIFKLGDIKKSFTQYYEVTADFTHCGPGKVNINYGADCTGYPTSVATASCKKSLIRTLEYTPEQALLQTIFKQQPGGSLRPALCEEMEYLLEVNNAGGEAKNLSLTIPVGHLVGLEYVENSAKFTSVFTTDQDLSQLSSATYTPVSSGDVLLSNGNLIITISATDFPKLGNSERFYIGFKLVAKECDFKSGQSISAIPNGKNFCGSAITNERLLASGSNRIILDGAPEEEPTVNLGSTVMLNVAKVGEGLTATYSSSIENVGKGVLTFPVTGLESHNADAKHFVYKYSVKLPAGWEFESPNSVFEATKAKYAGTIDPVKGYVFDINKDIAYGDKIEITKAKLIYKGDAKALDCEHEFGDIQESLFTYFTPKSDCDNTPEPCISELVTAENSTPLKVSKPAAPSGPAKQVFCISNLPVVGNLSINNPNESVLEWFADLTTTSSLPRGTALIDGATYYAANRLVDGSNCISERFAVVVKVDAAALATAGIDQISFNSGVFTLAGNIPVVGQVGEWTVVSVTKGGVVFGNNKIYNARITLEDGAVAVLKWTVTNGSCISEDEVTITYNRQVDLGITKTANQKTANVGNLVSYDLVVTNYGPGKLFAGNTIVIKDNLPAGLSNASYSFTGGTYDFNTGEFVLASDLEVNGTVKVSVSATVDNNFKGTTILNTATVAGPADVTDPKPSNNNDDELINVVRLIDLAVSKTANKEPVSAGEELIYSIKVLNNGPATLDIGEVITLTETLPAAGFTNPTFTSADGTYNHATSKFTLEKVLATGDAIELFVKGLIPANTKLSTLQNKVSVIAPDGVIENNTGNNRDDVTTNIIRSTDLAVVKTADKTSVIAGEKISYTITVTNNGPSTLFKGERVEFIESLPKGLSNITYVVNGGIYLDKESEFRLANDWGKGASFEVKIFATVDADYIGTTLVNTVEVNPPSGVTDSDSTNNEAVVTTPVERIVDLSVTKVAEKTTVVAGEALNYTITVTNNGVSTLVAGDILGLDEQIPVGLTKVSFTATGGTYDANAKTFKLAANLAKGASFEIKVAGVVDANYTANNITNKVKVSTPPDVKDNDLTNNEASVTTPVTRTADLAVVKVANKATVIASEGLEYTITVTNNGVSTLVAGEIVGFDEQVPAGLSNVTYQAVGGIYDATAKTFKLAADLIAGASFEVKVFATVNADYVGKTLVNTVKVATPNDVTDSNPDNNEAKVTTEVVRKADLAVVKVADKTTVTAGEALNYTITVTNNGVSTLVVGDVVGLDEQLPTALTNVSFTSAGGTYDAKAKTFTLNKALATGASFEVKVSSTVAANYTASTIVNTVKVTTPEGVIDEDPTNNESSVTTNVERKADIAVLKVADKTLVTAGEPLNYTITVTNKGVSTLVSGEVLGFDEQIPAGLTKVSFTSKGGVYDAIAKTFTLNADLIKGGTIEVKVLATVEADYLEKTIVNKVTVSTPTDVTDIDPSDNESTVVTNVERITDLAVKKVADKTTVVAGEALNYTITVTNNGVSTLVTGELLGLEEQLPVGLTKVSFTATGGTYDANAKTFKLAANLAKGASFEIKVAGIVDANYTANSITNKVIVSQPDGVDDSNPSNNEDEVTTIVTRTADLAVVKVANKATVIASEDLEYTITVTNNGVSTLVAGEIVGFDEQLPAGLSNVTYQVVGGIYDATAKTFKLAADLIAGASFEVKVFATVNADYVGKTLVNTVKVETPKDVTDSNPDNNEAKVTTEVVRKADLAVVKVADKTTVTAGEALNYTITVTNNGVSTLIVGDVVGLDEQLPTALTNVSFTSAGGTYDAKAKTFTLNKALATGESFEVKVSSTVAANYTASTIVNTVKVTTPEGVIDEDPTNNESTVTTQVERKADLGVEKFTDKSAVVAGEDIAYRIVVKNNGNSSILKGERIGLVETLPAAVENVRFTSTDGTYDFASSSFTLNNDLEKGGSIVLQVTARVKSSTVEGHKLINHVKVSTPAAVIDEDPTNDESEVISNVIRIADLKVEKTVLNSKPLIGLETTFTVTVTNNGPSDATGTTVFDKLKSGYEFVSATTSKGTYDAGTGLWTIGDMPLGAKATMSMIVRVLATGDYANTAIVDLVETDNIIENNEVTITPTPIPAPPIAVDDAVTTKSNTPVDIFILDNDKPGLTNSPLVPGSVEIITQPKNGTITIDADGKVIYTPNHGYVGQDDFVYRVKDELGFWSNEATVTITIVANDLFIPNVFTPNGDGKNDNFVIIGIEGYERVAITIVNRWGNEVYRNENYDNTWSGKGLNEGTYYYIITPHKNGKSEVIKGWVLIKKR